MDVTEALETRRSIRRYTGEPVERDLLLKVVELCRYAPSGGNKQEWELILVDDSEKVDSVFDTLAWLPAVGAPPEGKRPSAYIVVISDEKSDGLADCACVTTYALLAAHSQGLGSCWFGSIRRTELAKILSIPDHYSIEFVVSLGYSGEEVKTVNGHTDVSVDDGVTWVSKRTVSDMTHLNSFGKRSKK